MRRLACFIAGLFIALTPDVAHATEGHVSEAPVVITDPTQVPSDSSFVTEGCVTNYEWTTYAEPVPQEDGTVKPGYWTQFVYTDSLACHFQITPDILVVDRCGWLRDSVRVRQDERYKSVVVEQIRKTKWRVRLVARDNYIIVKAGRTLNRPYATITYTLRGKTC